MEAFDKDLNTYIEGCETKRCTNCEYVGEVSDFAPECPICNDIEEENFELKKD